MTDFRVGGEAAQALTKRSGSTFRVGGVRAQVLRRARPATPSDVYAVAVLADSPLGYWRLDESSGTVMFDYSGNKRDGTYTGSPTLGVASLLPAISDLAISFDGNNTRLASVATASWMDVSPFTIEAVIKPATITGSGYQFIADRDANGTAGPWWFVVHNGKLELLTWVAGANVALVGSTTLVANTTYHVAATYDGTNMRVFINGVQDGIQARTGTLATGTSQPLRIGGWGTVGAYWFNGVMDEVAFYGTALSAARLLAHFNAGFTTGVTISGGYATETDSATAGTTTNNRTVLGGLPVEGETALAGTTTVNSLILGGVPAETNIALAGATRVNSVIVGGTAVEGEAALAGTRTVGVLVLGGTAVEGETALAGSVTAGSLILGGVAGEGEAALAGTTLVGVVVPGGMAVEGETALAGTTTVSTLVHGGIAPELDGAFGGQVNITVPGGMAIEGEAALAGGTLQTIHGGATLEVQLAPSGTVNQLVYGGIVDETDTVIAGLTHVHVIGGLPTDTETIPAGHVIETIHGGLADEIDSIFAGIVITDDWRWWDGSVRQHVMILGWWDGTDIQPTQQLGWWDGAEIQPI